METSIPDFLTHYYREQPFRSLTELSSDSLEGILARLRETRELPCRLRTPSYFENRRRVEQIMYEQFLSKGGRPERVTAQIWSDEPLRRYMTLHVANLSESG